MADDTSAQTPSSIPFSSSKPGRLLLLAAAVFLLSAGCRVAAGPAWVYGLGMPAGITISFVAVGLGMAEHTKETLFATIMGPVVLWAFTYLACEFNYASATSWSWGIGLVGVLALLKAIKGPSADAA